MTANGKYPQTLAQEEHLIRGLFANGVEVMRLPMQSGLLLRFECLKHHMVCWEPVVIHPLTIDAPVLHDVCVANTIEAILVAINRRHDVGFPRI